MPQFEVGQTEKEMEGRMKTIELSDEQYLNLLYYKNIISMKVREITNPLVLGREIDDDLMCAANFEPEYSFGQCIADTIGSVMEEQETGQVNYIT